MMDKSKAIFRLKKALEAIPELKKLSSSSPEFEKWQRDTEVAISNIFGNGSRNIKDFSDISYSLSFFTTGTPQSAFHNAYLRGLSSAEANLRSMVDEINDYWEDKTVEPSADGNPSHKASDTPLNTVFIIHGHDNGTKETVARFISKLKLHPIILHEQPNKGATIIEKFERNADVGFAIALLTPDDVGAIATSPNELKPRARQNVVLEFGYFLGKLGRSRVVALTKGHVELPSDYDGVLYIPIDPAGAWHLSLVKEIKSAGLNVDANLAI